MSSYGEDIIRETFEKFGDAIGVQMQMPAAMITNLGAVLQAQIDLLAELQSAGRLIPAGGMALTAEQMEDVEALVATANPYSAPAVRLRALFPATEPASYCSKGVCSADEGHDGTCAEASGWAHDAYEDGPVPVEPAEEETKGETHDPDALAKRLAWIWHDGWDACGERERGYLRRAAEMAHSHYASSPVVPDPTETEWATPTAIPVGVPFKDREGSEFVKLADGTFGYLKVTRETRRTLAEFAPFVAAAEEGDA